MKKFLLLALSQLFALCVFADGFPRYYELVQETSQLESGKYYIIAAVPDDSESLTNRIAYNGIDTDNHYGRAARVSVPATYIIDIGSTEKHAVPLKFISNGEKWNLYDESVNTNQLIGVNSDTESSSGSQHYLVTGNNKDDNLFLWYITVSSGIATILIQKTINNIYYLRYDSNNYNDPTSFFRVYSLTDNKLRVMLYKEMETVNADTYYIAPDPGTLGTLYYSNKVLMVPEGVTAKTYILGQGENKGKVVCSVAYETGSFIPANSAVVLHGTSNADKTYTFPVTTRHNPTRDGDNILRGLDTEDWTTSGGNDSDYYFYKLTTKNGANPGFYWSENNGARFWTAAHKAYLAILQKQAANVREFLLNSNTSTAITTPIYKAPADDAVYDLTGRKVDSSQALRRGIYITKGKKFVVK